MYDAKRIRKFDDWVNVLRYYELKDETNLDGNDYNSVEITSKPTRDSIKKIHIYDFDGTLFYTPNIFYDSFTKRAVDYIIPFKGLVNGGWWCYKESVEAYIKKWIEEKEVIPDELLFEKPKDKMKGGICFCEGCKIDSKYWSYDILKAMERSYDSSDTLTILMTGRRLDRFYETFHLLLKTKLRNRIVFHDELRVDSIFLKKDFKYTIEYKTKVLKDLLINFPLVNELTMYDDRTDQIKGMYTWMKNNSKKLRDIRFTRDKNRPKNVSFDIAVVEPKVGRYESKEQLALIEGLITRNNKNCFEQQISIDVEIFSDYYIALPQNDVRFIKGLVEYIVPSSYQDFYSKNVVIGLQFLDFVNIDRKDSRVTWVIDSVNVCLHSIYVSVFNRYNRDEKGIVITHYKDDHRKTLNHMKHDIKNGTFCLLLDKQRVTFSLDEEKILVSKNHDFKENVDVNRDYQWSNMEIIDGERLAFAADFGNINNLMLIDLKELSDE